MFLAPDDVSNDLVFRIWVALLEIFDDFLRLKKRFANLFVDGLFPINLGSVVSIARTKALIFLKNCVWNANRALPFLSSGACPQEIVNILQPANGFHFCSWIYQAESYAISVVLATAILQR